jgi:hypothetical protein
MNEAVLAGRIEKLERSNRRWRLATFILGVLFLCSLATGGTFVALLMKALPEQRQMEEVVRFEQHARRAAEQAQRQAESAKIDAEEARRRLQRELEAAKENRR